MKGEYSNQVVNGKMCVWLQEHGWQPAKLGKDLVVGDVLVYNFGGHGEIVSIDRETPACLFVSVRCDGAFRDSEKKVYPNIRIGKNTYKPVLGA